MNMEELLESIRHNEENRFPREELEGIISRKEEASPYLLQIMQELRDDYKQFMGQLARFDFIYAYYLLAQFREQALYPMMIEILSMPGDITDEIFDDLITEDLGRVLASTYNGEVKLLQSLIENKEANVYARGQALKSLVILVYKGRLSREFVLEYFRELMNEKRSDTDYTFHTELVMSSENLYPAELYPDIKRLYDDEVIDSFVISLEDLDDTLKGTLDEIMQRNQGQREFQFIEDTIEEMQNWASFQKEPEELQALFNLPEVTGIPDSETWTRIEPVLKGWSSDRKYYIENQAGDKLLLRLSGREQRDRKQAEYEVIQLMNQLDVPMSQAIDCGVCNEGQDTYMLLSWVEGRPLEDCLLLFTTEKQHWLGVQAGRILRQIHSVPNDNNLSGWEQAMQSKVLARIKEYEHCSYRVEGDEAAITYVKENIGVIRNVEKVYQHGDFHVGNLIYTDQDQIGVIDFNRWDSGDYVEEYYKLQSFDREWSIPFAKGRIEGYFDGEPPQAFWERLALYVAYASLFSIKWAIPYGQADIEGMMARCRMALEDYDDFRLVIPRWYTEE